MPGVGKRPVGLGREQGIGEDSWRDAGSNRGEQGALGRLAVAYLGPTPEPALERG